MIDYINPANRQLSKEEWLEDHAEKVVAPNPDDPPRYGWLYICYMPDRGLGFSSAKVIRSDEELALVFEPRNVAEDRQWYRIRVEDLWYAVQSKRIEGTHDKVMREDDPEIE